MSVAVTWPGSNGTAFSGTLWATSTYNNVGAAGSDTFTVQSAKGRIACVAGAGDSKQQARYVHSNGNHSTTFQYRGTITWSAVGGEATNFLVRSDNVVVANSNYCANCYVFEFDNVANTIVCYKVTGSTPAVITSAPAAAPFTFVAGTVYNVLFDLSGYVLGVKIWTGSEPGPYTYTVTDPDSSVNSATVGKFAWANYHLPTTATNIDIGDATFTSDKWVEASPDAPRSVGTAHFESTGGSTSLTLTATSAVTSVGTAYAPGGKVSPRSIGTGTGAGAAYNATVSTAGSGVSVPATVASSAGTAHTATVARRGNPAAATATSTALAIPATVTTNNGAVSATAQVATGAGDAASITYLLDEFGLPILDEFGQLIYDGYGLTLRIAFTPTTVGGVGASNTPSRSIAPRVGFSLSVGSAPAPSVTTVGDSTTTNVNAALAVGAGAAHVSQTAVAPTSGATATGVAGTPQVTIPVQAAIAESVGVAYDIDAANPAGIALSVGAAYDAQVALDANNFVATAPIPIFASAADASVAIVVNPDGITVVGTAPTASNHTAEPGQLVTLRDHGHTVTLKER